MHTETERKFLVRNEGYKAVATACHHLVQGYLAAGNGNSVRVRTADGKAFLTIKGPSANGISRLEWEKEIPMEDAHALLSLCTNGLIDKNRYIVPVEDSRHFFEVDEFFGDNEGLTVAEIELDAEDEQFARPDWLGKEVTGDKRYYNLHLVSTPFKKWRP